MSKPVKRLLGMEFDGTPIFAASASHSMLLAAAGGWKTTAGAMTWILSLIADHNRGLIINDCKDGEMAAQCADLCKRYGRKVAIIDDFGVLGKDNPHRISITPFGSMISAYEQDNGELIFSTENTNHALIPDPPNDSRNQFFRDEPRTLQEFAELALLKRKPELATPGGVWALIANPETLKQAAAIEAEEGDEVLSALGAHVLDMAENDRENYGKHRGAALKSLRIFSAGSPLHNVGADAEITHTQLLKDHYIVFIVGPQRHMARLGAYYALHLQSFVDALLSGISGSVDFILDEATNAPLKALISALTTMRGYGGNCHIIAQSRSELQRAFGDKETETIEDQAIIKQYFGFSSFAEAERLSRAMGESQVINQGLSFNSGKLEYSGNISTGKDRTFPAERLMRLKPDEQIIHVKNLGFIHCKKIAQHQIAPFCHGELANNPLEGPQRAADPKVTLFTDKRGK
ncbi:MAG: type IV secretion system protein VirD4 [Robiginitomaculum sp.]|nr:MAG: type IV secretion system protein VirD4 [Robiginitomaculum sp.]